MNHNFNLSLRLVRDGHLKPSLFHIANSLDAVQQCLAALNERKVQLSSEPLALIYAHAEELGQIMSDLANGVVR